MILSRSGVGWLKSRRSVKVSPVRITGSPAGKLISLLPVLSPQSSLAQHKDFGAAFEPLQKKLLDLRIRIQAENGLQRDLPGKQAQLSRLQVRGLWSLSHLCSGAPRSCPRPLQ